MGQILTNLSTIINNNEEIKTHIPFESQEQENLSWDEMLTYVDVKQKFKYKIPIKKSTDPVKYIYLENLKIRKIIVESSHYVSCLGHPDDFKSYEDTQYYFEKGETFETIESINGMMRYKSNKETSKFTLT